MENVVITITQEETTIATLTTNASGEAHTLLNAGNYSVTFTYPNRNPYTVPLAIAYDDTMLVFAFPGVPIGTSGNLSSTFEVSQEGDLDMSMTPQIFSSTISFVNT